MSSTSLLARVDPERWRLDATLPGERRRRLLASPPYDEIVASMKTDLTLEIARCQRSKSGERSYRVVAKLRSTPAAIDLFHNSASGYRAQYLLGTSQGEAANRYALDELLPIVVPLLIKRRPNFPSVILEQSLRHPWTKVWIHQGVWLRRARRDQQVLHVPDWEARSDPSISRVRKLVRWGTLAPDAEPAFVLKGGFVLPDGSHRLGQPPKNRAEDIHTCGFT
jgi:hypothetical protein